MSHLLVLGIEKLCFYVSQRSVFNAKVHIFHRLEATQSRWLHAAAQFSSSLNSDGREKEEYLEGKEATVVQG